MTRIAQYVNVRTATVDSDTLRENAENCGRLAERSLSEPAEKRYRRMAEAWTALAEEQDWLDGNLPQFVRRTAY